MLLLSCCLKPAVDKKLKAEGPGIELIQDPYANQQLYTNLVNSAENEILLLLPTTSSFVRERKIGIIQPLITAARRGVKIHVLTPSNEIFTPEMNALLNDENINIEVRRIRRKSENHASNEARTKILVIGRQEYLIVELKDDSKETFIEAVQLAIYSNILSTVRAYITLFESLWEQAELYDQLESKEKCKMPLAVPAYTKLTIWPLGIIS
jgi:phosphatidylserine/phosphatidylglycerophosphate/cardiolipin synthase-like enzyme